LLRFLPARSTLFPYTTLFRSAVFTRSVVDLRSGDHLAQEISASLHERVLEQRGAPVVLLIVDQLVRDDRRQGARVAVHLRADQRSEEHTSELQSRSDLVCRLL